MGAMTRARSSFSTVASVSGGGGEREVRKAVRSVAEMPFTSLPLHGSTVTRGRRGETMEEMRCAVSGDQMFCSHGVLLEGLVHDAVAWRCW